MPGRCDVSGCAGLLRAWHTALNDRKVWDSSTAQGQMTIARLARHQTQPDSHARAAVHKHETLLI